MKLFFSKFILVVLFVVALSGCNFLSKKSDQKIKSDSYNDLKIVNVNDPEIYADAHISGDINISFDQLDNLKEITLLWPKSTTVVFYCTDYRCVASKYFAKALVDLGFEKVYAYSGGISEWYQLGLKDAGYKIEGPCIESYLKNVIDISDSSDIVEGGFFIITAKQLLQKIDDSCLPKR